MMMWRPAVALALMFGLSTLPAAAQTGPTGPGQAVPQPDAQCPQVIACTYSEQNMIPIGYRMQSLQVCGANCTYQYWVSLLDSGQQVLEIDPTRGGAVVAVNQAGGSNPDVRVVMPAYGPNDPGCCPSSYSDTTYSWDDASGTLVANQTDVTPADQFAGYEATRQELLAEGWIVAAV